ncbi:MAG: mannonate dehydratase, partial [Tannerella sp.]|jgi:mannonate dehydratase|nr:mannonate dehydratase [Tannerella sp.]
VLDWARTNLHYRDERGCESMLFDYPVFAAFDIYILNRPDAENDYDEAIRRQAKDINSKLTDAQKEELAHNIIVVTQAFINGTVDGNAPDYKRQFLNYLGTYKNIDRDKLRENLAAFLNDVIPTAEENGINMCIHADDPPFSLLGLPRIASAVDDFLWIVDRHASLSNGITFCVGSLSARSDNDLPEMARKLAPRIHFIHLRNTKTLEGRSFYESGHLAGNVDMFAVVKALLDEQQRRIREGRKDVGMPFRADHGLRILGDFERKANPGYPLYGRMKGVSEIDGMQKAIERMY